MAQSPVDMNRMFPPTQVLNDLCVFIGLSNEFPDLDLYACTLGLWRSHFPCPSLITKTQLVIIEIWTEPLPF